MNNCKMMATKGILEETHTRAALSIPTSSTRQKSDVLDNVSKFRCTYLGASNHICSHNIGPISITVVAHDSLHQYHNTAHLGIHGKHKYHPVICSLNYFLH